MIVSRPHAEVETAAGDGRGSSMRVPDDGEQFSPLLSLSRRTGDMRLTDPEIVNKMGDCFVSLVN